MGLGSVDEGDRMRRTAHLPARSNLRATRWLAGVAVVLLLPVPWLHVSDDDPPGMAWRLDGRLLVEGEVMDPAGAWSWLTVGRPPHLAEVATDWLVGGGEHTRDLREAPAANRPAINEPTAAAIGLAHAGADISFGLLVEAVGATSERYPERAVVTHVAGIEITDRTAWEAVQARLDGPVVFITEDGAVHTTSGPGLPYRYLHVTDVADGVDAAIAGRVSQHAPVAWFRNLALGRSHGMMVALVTYAATTGEDLAAGRHIAGTGGIIANGHVTRIGGLRAKAKAARDTGADVLLYPASQVDDLNGFDPRGMRLVPIDSLEQAISALRGAPTA
jgi:hypothetical protein